jgi:hypothetical protein
MGVCTMTMELAEAMYGNCYIWKPLLCCEVARGMPVETGLVPRHRCLTSPVGSIQIVGADS